MALRDQPYFPLYVQDYMTDEALTECSASAQGVYVRIMCLMHKSKEYGTILLRQKDKQNSSKDDSKYLNFANKLVKHLPFEMDIILNALEELVDEGVLLIDGDKLIQKRMVKDNQVSLARSEAGRKGGFATAKESAKYIAKDIANSENENENENINTINKRVEKFKTEVESFTQYKHLHHDFLQYWTEPNKSKTKMRWEMEPTWDTKRRLATWEKNSAKFGGKTTTSTTYKSQAKTDIELSEKYGDIDYEAYKNREPEQRKKSIHKLKEITDERISR